MGEPVTLYHPKEKRSIVVYDRATYNNRIVEGWRTSPVVQKPGPKKIEYNSETYVDKTLEELRSLAIEKGVKNATKMKRKTLIRHLES